MRGREADTSPLQLARQDEPVIWRLGFALPGTKPLHSPMPLFPLCSLESELVVVGSIGMV